LYLSCGQREVSTTAIAHQHNRHKQYHSCLEKPPNHVSPWFSPNLSTLQHLLYKTPLLIFHPKVLCHPRLISNTALAIASLLLGAAVSVENTVDTFLFSDNGKSFLARENTGDTTCT
jgi:hypothetical protein